MELLDVKKPRLCKSFTFLSQQGSDKSKNVDYDGRKKPINLHKKFASVFISEPYKLSLLPISLKSQQSNYLRNLSAFGTRPGGCVSISSLCISRLDSSPSSVVLIRNENPNECKCVTSNDSKTVGNDAAVQTSILSEGSLFEISN